mgnify:CR=1 FL=1
MAKLTIEEILAAIDELTVIELNDLVKGAEENTAYQQQLALQL